MPAVCLLLSAATSLFTTTWLLAAAPFTVTVEPVGLSVRANGDEVVVTQVVPGSPAAREGVKPQMRIQRIAGPMRPFMGPLLKLGAEDLQAALTPTWDEPLVLSVEPQGKQPERTFTLKRTDRAPRMEFPVVPLPDEQLSRLTAMQMQRYQVRLAQVMNGEPTFPEAPSLELQQEEPTAAWVTQSKLRVMDGGGFTGRWVHPRFVLKSACPLGKGKLEVRGPGAGRPLTLPVEHGSRHPSQDSRVDLPLWSLQDVTKACAAGLKELTAPVAATLSCQEDPVLKKSLPVKLALTCEQPLPRSGELELLVNRGTRTYRVGAQGVVKLEVLLSTLFPQATSFTMVQVDEQGQVSRRFDTRPVPADARGMSSEVTLDTTFVHTVHLAAELKFADGSTRLTLPEEVVITTPERQEQQARAKAKDYGDLMGISQRLTRELKSACADVPKTVAWLQAQPEVESASSHGEGHSIFYRMKDSGESLSILCHRR
ncbi:MAG: hypothetical protein EOO71_05525 [Myxococcaceae bacterium]|nr:MAG: hypothetical protein EOO71_05525 [Myxococcaceae bacterium]